jgi:hypothetical protein
LIPFLIINHLPTQQAYHVNERAVPRVTGGPTIIEEYLTYIISLQAISFKDIYLYLIEGQRLVLY